MTTQFEHKAIIIADFLFANPNYGRREVLNEFLYKWHTSTRTIDRLLQKAYKYNIKKLQMINRIKNDVLYKHTLESM